MRWEEGGGVKRRRSFVEYQKTTLNDGLSKIAIFDDVVFEASEKSLFSEGRI